MLKWQQKNGAFRRVLIKHYFFLHPCRKICGERPQVVNFSMEQNIDAIENMIMYLFVLPKGENRIDTNWHIDTFTKNTKCQKIVYSNNLRQQQNKGERILLDINENFSMKTTFATSNTRYRPSFETLQKGAVILESCRR